MSALPGALPHCPGQHQHPAGHQMAFRRVGGRGGCDTACGLTSLPLSQALSGWLPCRG